MRKHSITSWLWQVLAICAIVVGVGACTQPTGGDTPDPEPTTTEPTGDEGDDGPVVDEPGAEAPDEEEPGIDPPSPEIRSLTIDFQNATEGVVAEEFDASGALQEPAAGQLDADAWEVLGFSDGDRRFGEESTMGDHARGTSGGGVSTGGLYAFTVEEDNIALGVQATAGDFAPGSITLKVPLELWPKTTVNLGYTIWVYNDQDRSSEWSVACSLDGETWTDIDEIVLVTPELADIEPEWTRSVFTLETRLEFSPDQLGHDGLYIRWTSTDAGGAGGRDETAIDDITVSLSPET